MAEVRVDAETFKRRCTMLLESLAGGGAEGSPWAGASVCAVACGKAQTEQLTYNKSALLGHWLFGYELPETILLFAAGKMHIVSSKKKCAIVGAVADDDPSIDFVSAYVRPKGEGGAAQIKEAMDAAGVGAGATVAHLAKESPEGDLCASWSSALSASGAAAVDAADALGRLLAVKDAGEVLSIKKAAHLAASAMKDHAVAKIEEAVDTGRAVTHAALAESTEAAVTDPQRIKVKLKADRVDVCYPPIFVSGEGYDFKYSKTSDNNKLKSGVMAVMIGARYSQYCANVQRTYMVDPTKPKEKAYRALLAAQEAAIAACVAGAPCSAPHAAAKASLEASAEPALAARLAKSVGFGIGLEFREGGLLLSPKNEGRALEPGMALNVAVSLTGLTDPSPGRAAEPKEYGMTLADTVVVRAGGEAPEVATARAAKGYDDVAYQLSDDGAEADAEIAREGRGARGEGPSVVMDEKLRGEEAAKEARRQEQQRSLQDRKNEETAARLLKAQGAAAERDAAAKSKADRTAYRSPEHIPASSQLEIAVDSRNEAVLLPIRGLLVPFHIASVKNAAVRAEGTTAYIHINFNTPGAGQYLPAHKYPAATFIREATFKTSDVRHANQVVQAIKGLRKVVMDKDKEKAEREDLVQQEALKLTPGRAPRLRDLWVRPTLGGKGRKMAGSLEAHINGFRYQTPKGEVVDVMYRNIRHCLFQKAEGEAIVLLHFRLKNPIMMGKKKSSDVQFYSEVMEVVQNLDGRRSNAYDPEEVDEEQREAERRAKANADFHDFTTKVNDAWERAKIDLEFDAPYRDLGFTGVPYKESVLIMPTVHCLCSLIESPFFVLTLDDIEIVNLERVGFGLKNFDMAIVFKDFDQPVHRIDAIPTTKLEQVKEWLNTINVKYYESKMNLSWKPILKTIMEDPQQFLDSGGWEFLNMEGGSDDEEAESDQSDDFEPDEDESSEEEEDDDDDDVSMEDEDDDDDDDDPDEELSDEGKDWDELEEEARADDKNRAGSDDDDDRRRKRPAGGGGGGGRGPPGKYRRK